MPIAIIAVGKARHAERDLANEYLSRIKHYTRCEEIELRQSAELERAILSHPGIVVALEVHGEMLTSTSFARRLDEWMSRDKGAVTFVVGGADGIPPAISTGADSRLSLSSLTLPHRLARVLLYEQLYRAFTILRNEPYAREG